MNLKKQKRIRCLICQKDIFLKTDSYVQVKDFKDGECFMEGFYHYSCWHEAMHKKTIKTIKEKAIDMLRKIKGKEDTIETLRLV
jgi:hemerythrin